VNRIFVKSVNWVGDAVLVTPALRALRRAFPRAHITLLARPWVADVFEANPDIDRLWTAEESKSFRRFREIAARMRREAFDLGIALPNSFGSALLMAMGRVKRRVGYRRDGRGFLLTDAVAVTPEILKVHQVDYYLHLLRGICDVDAQPRELVVPAAPDADLHVRRVLRDAGVGEDNRSEGGRPLVGLSPGATFGSAKRWLPERFAAVADYVAQKYAAQVVIAGSKGESAVAKDVARRAKSRVVVLCGLFPLRGVIALCDHLRLLVTNDSGNMHIAAARGVPIVAIFGSTDWVTTAPYHPRAIIVRRATPCAPCLLRHCPPELEHACMESVTVEDVIEAVDKQMERA